MPLPLMGLRPEDPRQNRESYFPDFEGKRCFSLVLCLRQRMPQEDTYEALAAHFGAKRTRPQYHGKKEGETGPAKRHIVDFSKYISSRRALLLRLVSLFRALGEL